MIKTSRIKAKALSLCLAIIKIIIIIILLIIVIIIKIIIMIMSYPHKDCIFFKIFFEKKLKGVAPLASPAETSFSGMEDV